MIRTSKRSSNFSAEMDSLTRPSLHGDGLNVGSDSDLEQNNKTLINTDSDASVPELNETGDD